MYAHTTVKQTGLAYFPRSGLERLMFAWPQSFMSFRIEKKLNGMTSLSAASSVTREKATSDV